MAKIKIQNTEISVVKYNDEDITKALRRYHTAKKSYSVS